jgi:O-antigen/teichoic acid export membrane protein
VGVGLSLVLLPVGALLEGCNQVSFVYGLRTISRAGSAVVGWVAMWGGAELFTGPLMVLSTVLVLAGAYLWRWRELLRDLWRAPAGGEAISWRREIWPFHWRIAISCVSGYFIFNFFTPVLFYFHGPVVAGQMGATMSLVTSLSGLAQSWTVSKGPRFGMLISRREFAELDRLFYRATAQAVGICLMGGLALLLGLLVVRGHFAIGARFLDPGPTSLLVLATIVNQIVFGQAIYLRAHKQEPFMILSAVNGLITGCLVAVLGCFFGAWGVSLAYAAVQIAMFLWATQVWRDCRNKWHRTGTTGRSGGLE